MDSNKVSATEINQPIVVKYLQTLFSALRKFGIEWRESLVLF
jgi:hypothetical protein